MLVGPNGAGKSTLIEAIAQGVPYTGRISLEGAGYPRPQGAERARSVGFSRRRTRSATPIRWRRSFRWGAMRMRRASVRARRRRGSVRRARLEWTGLTALRRASVLTLSGGELQRTFLAQVFAQNPKLLILDEPANHLDLIYQKHIFFADRGVAEAAWARGDLRRARFEPRQKYGTHAVLMDCGRCAAQGKTAEVMTRERLEAVYGMDVYGWMRDLLGQWS